MQQFINTDPDWHTQGFGSFTHKNADGRDAYNFSAGPCQLPKAVLSKAAEEMLNYKGCGQSVMELSHRQDEFRHISKMTKDEIRKFLQVPPNFRVLLQ
jgi:phosphoserine aminotransferase